MTTMKTLLNTALETRIAAVAKVIDTARHLANENIKDIVQDKKLSYTLEDDRYILKVLNINEDEFIAKMNALLEKSTERRINSFIENFAEMTSEEAAKKLAADYTELVAVAATDFSVEKLMEISADLNMAVATNDDKWLIETIDDNYGYSLIASYLYDEAKKAA